eukprot:GHVU01166195.1.p1 GENE.GHVU01166195.1~~GHVU01166195.1.p1  ORF type:complete len:273 (+),score=89.88 GHVU01166195.1:408-1226(+)
MPPQQQQQQQQPAAVLAGQMTVAEKQRLTEQLQSALARLEMTDIVLQQQQQQQAPAERDTRRRRTQQPHTAAARRRRHDGGPDTAAAHRQAPFDLQIETLQPVDTAVGGEGEFRRRHDERRHTLDAASRHALLAQDRMQCKWIPDDKHNNNDSDNADDGDDYSNQERRRDFFKVVTFARDSSSSSSAPPPPPGRGSSSSSNGAISCSNAADTAAAAAAAANGRLSSVGSLPHSGGGRIGASLLYIYAERGGRTRQPASLQPTLTRTSSRPSE